MTPRERGFLLLTAKLGDPNRPCLTMAQYRALLRKVRASQRPSEDGVLTVQELKRIGCEEAMAERVVALLSQQKQLADYLRAGEKCGCLPLTRISAGYPQRLHARLGLDAPTCLWLKGDTSLLSYEAISLVGSRDIRSANAEFAAAVGNAAAREGIVLVSGNARGADETAQNACLQSGGSVISVLADEMHLHRAGQRQLLVCEDGYDVPFSPQRALRRNRIIHALGSTVYVAQCSVQKGGSWDGAVRNLQNRWSRVACFDDGSEGSRELMRLGATPIRTEALADLVNLPELPPNFLGE